MPLLRRRRDRRSRAAKRSRRTCRKFIPDSDSDFAWMARTFARGIAREPASFGVSDEQVRSVSEAVKAFRKSLSVVLVKDTRNSITIMRKDAARQKAEGVIRTAANQIRGKPDVSCSDKAKIGMKERSQRLRKRACPSQSPYLRFRGAIDGGGPGSVRHVLSFREQFDSSTRAKPEGAVRLELFVDLVPPGEPVPQHPTQRWGRTGGRACAGAGGWYLRSFTTSPVEVEFPIPSEPMLVVYWGRWANARGEVGTFSQTCVARVEGWSSALPSLPSPQHALRESESTRRIERAETKYVFVQAPYQLPDAGGLEGDEQRDEIAELMSHGQRMLEAAAVKMLEAA